jgi:hypothetical protein
MDHSGVDAATGNEERHRPASTLLYKKEGTSMPPNFNFPFVLSVVGAMMASSVVATLYVWPALRALPSTSALRILSCLQSFRFFGLNFIVVGFVAPGLNPAVASQIAWGDFIAAVLALLSVATLTWRSPLAIPIVWIANLWGIADLLNAYYKGGTQVADVGMFSAGIYVPALFVPLLFVAHILTFRLLLKRSDAKVKDGHPLPAGSVLPSPRAQSR